MTSGAKNVPAMAVKTADGSVKSESARDAHLRFREALRNEDTAEVVRCLAIGARRPTERDLLVDLIAAQGAKVAVQRLSRFWQQAVPTITRVRSVTKDEAEVYERIDVQNQEPLRSVTLLRRIDEEWHVVATQTAPDDHARIWILRDDDSPPLDDLEFTRSWITRFGPTAELAMKDGTGALTNPSKGWIARVVGPVESNGRIPETVIAADRQPKTVIEVSLRLSENPEERGQQLIWIAQAAAAMAWKTRSGMVYVPYSERPLVVEALIAEVWREDPDIAQAARVFARLSTEGEWLTTRGLGLLMLPELELQISDWDDPKHARKAGISVLSALIAGRRDVSPGVVVRSSGQRLVVMPGRRGPNTSSTYGPYGAIRLRPLNSKHAMTNSETVVRVDID